MLLYFLPQIANQISKKKEEKNSLDYSDTNPSLHLNNSANQEINSKKSISNEIPVIGGKVFHRVFGTGIIKEIDKERDRITVVFGSVEKVFVLSSAIGRYLKLIS